MCNKTTYFDKVNIINVNIIYCSTNTLLTINMTINITNLLKFHRLLRVFQDLLNILDRKQLHKDTKSHTFRTNRHERKTTC